MRVRADYRVARGDYSLLRKERVFHSHLSDFKVVFKFLLPGEFAEDLRLLRRLDVLVRSEMIRYQAHTVLVKNFLRARVLKFADGYRGSDVVAEDYIQFCPDKFPRFDLFFPGVRRKYLFRYRHPHCSSPVILRFYFTNFTNLTNLKNLINLMNF